MMVPFKIYLPLCTMHSLKLRAAYKIYRITIDIDIGVHFSPRELSYTRSFISWQEVQLNNICGSFGA